VTADGREDLDRVVTAALDEALAAVPGSVVRFARSDSFALPTQPDSGVRDLATFGYVQGLEEHATIVDGAWPTDGSAPNGSLPVAISDRVADTLHLAVGDDLDLTSRLDPSVLVPVAIAGIFHVDDPAAAFWLNEPQMLEGIGVSERFTTYGPFLTTLDNLLARTTVNQVPVGWRAFPDFGKATLTGVGDVSARVKGLGPRIAGATGGAPAVTVTTDLPSILEQTTQSLLVSRAGVLVLTVQLVILAVYAVLLSAALLVEHRRIDTAMLRSRGAGPSRIAGMAAAEGAVLVVAAALVGPWLARGAAPVRPRRTLGRHRAAARPRGRQGCVRRGHSGRWAVADRADAPGVPGRPFGGRRPGRDGARTHPERGTGRSRQRGVVRHNPPMRTIVGRRSHETDVG
jgi:hypothetical protein